MPESNRQPAACAAALPLSQCRLAETSRPGSGMRHGSAARTGRDTNPRRWKPFDRCIALPVSSTGNPFAHAFPAAARTEHRGAALARLVAEFRDSGDPRADLDVRAFAL